MRILALATLAICMVTVTGFGITVRGPADGGQIGHPRPTGGMGPGGPRGNRTRPDMENATLTTVEVNQTSEVVDEVIEVPDAVVADSDETEVAGSGDDEEEEENDEDPKDMCKARKRGQQLKKFAKKNKKVFKKTAKISMKIGKKQANLAPDRRGNNPQRAQRLVALKKKLFTVKSRVMQGRGSRTPGQRPLASLLAMHRSHVTGGDRRGAGMARGGQKPPMVTSTMQRKMNMSEDLVAECENVTCDELPEDCEDPIHFASDCCPTCADVDDDEESLCESIECVGDEVCAVKDNMAVCCTEMPRHPLELMAMKEAREEKERKQKASPGKPRRKNSWQQQRPGQGRQSDRMHDSRRGQWQQRHQQQQQQRRGPMTRMQQQRPQRFPRPQPQYRQQQHYPAARFGGRPQHGRFQGQWNQQQQQQRRGPAMRFQQFFGQRSRGYMGRPQARSHRNQGFSHGPMRQRWQQQQQQQRRPFRAMQQNYYGRRPSYQWQRSRNNDRAMMRPQQQQQQRRWSREAPEEDLRDEPQEPMRPGRGPQDSQRRNRTSGQGPRRMRPDSTVTGRRRTDTSTGGRNMPRRPGFAKPPMDVQRTHHRGGLTDARRPQRPGMRRAGTSKKTHHLGRLLRFLGQDQDSCTDSSCPAGQKCFSVHGKTACCGAQQRRGQQQRGSPTRPGRQQQQHRRFPQGLGPMARRPLHTQDEQLRRPMMSPRRMPQLVTSDDNATETSENITKVEEDEIQVLGYCRLPKSPVYNSMFKERGCHCQVISHCSVSLQDMDGEGDDDDDSDSNQGDDDDQEEPMEDIDQHNHDDEEDKSEQEKEEDMMFSGSGEDKTTDDYKMDDSQDVGREYQRLPRDPVDKDVFFRGGQQQQQQGRRGSPDRRGYNTDDDDSDHSYGRRGMSRDSQRRRPSQARGRDSRPMQQHRRGNFFQRGNDRRGNFFQHGNDRRGNFFQPSRHNGPRRNAPRPAPYGLHRAQQQRRPKKVDQKKKTGAMDFMKMHRRAATKIILKQQCLCPAFTADKEQRQTKRAMRIRQRVKKMMQAQQCHIKQ